MKTVTCRNCKNKNILKQCECGRCEKIIFAYKEGRLYRPVRFAHGHNFAIQASGKESWHYKAGRHIIKVCRVCNKSFDVLMSQASRYGCCSLECRNKNSRAYTYLCLGCRKFFISHEDRWEQQFCSLSCLRKTRHETRPEKKVRIMLTQLGIPFAQEFKLGRYSVDFAIPNARIAIEVDGDYWHRNKDRDSRKNEYIKSRGWKLVRLKENEVLAIQGLDQLRQILDTVLLTEACNDRTDGVRLD